MDITIEHITRHTRRTVAFDLDPVGNSIAYRGVADAPPNYAVFSYEEERDLVYRTPEALAPQSLAGETAIHFPDQLIAQLGQTPLTSSLGHLALIQPVISVATRISPLSALQALLARIASVNTALLAAENGGLLFVREAAGQFEAHASAESLETFVNVKPEERQQRFPDFDALEVIVLGSDALRSDAPHKFEFELERVRLLRAADIASFLSSAEPLDREDLLRDGLAIATASLVLDILREVA